MAYRVFGLCIAVSVYVSTDLGEFGHSTSVDTVDSRSSQHKMKMASNLSATGLLSFLGFMG